MFSKTSVKAFCLHVFHIPDSHLPSAASSGQLAAGLQQREAVSRDMAWLFTEERSVQRKGCVAHEQRRLVHAILGIIPSLFLILEYISEGEPSEVTKVSVHGAW